MLSNSHCESQSYRTMRVTEREAECVGESHQQQRFRGAVIADERQRIFVDEGGQERGL